MTNRKPYTDIGPFKRVPETARARCAAAANLASGRAYDAALRAAKDLRDNGYKTYIDVYPSPIAVAASWDEEAERTKERNSIHFNVMMTVPYWAIFLLMGAAAIAARTCDPHAPLGFGIGLFGFGLFAFIVCYCLGYRDCLRWLRELKTQGFVENTMPDALAKAATNVWLFAGGALVIAEPGDGDTIKTRTIFYDAIGTATVTVENGYEGVTITARDGQTLGRIAKPEGEGVGSADDLVVLIRIASATARRAA